MTMDGKIISVADDRKSSHGLSIGQRVKLVIGGEMGTIIGFAAAWHNGVTVHTKLDSGMGNMGDFHSCGNSWVEAI